jgi:hypothetical protein
MKLPRRKAGSWVLDPTANKKYKKIEIDSIKRMN